MKMVSQSKKLGDAALDYIGYCRHGIMIYWTSVRTPPSMSDYKSVYEMRRGTVEEARYGLETCNNCIEEKKVQK